MKLPLEMYSTDPDVAVGSWVLLEVGTAEEQDANIGTVPVRKSRRARENNVTIRAIGCNC